MNEKDYEYLVYEDFGNVLILRRTFPWKEYAKNYILAHPQDKLILYKQSK